MVLMALMFTSREALSYRLQVSAPPEGKQEDKFVSEFVRLPKSLRLCKNSSVVSKVIFENIFFCLIGEWGIFSALC